LTNAGNVIAAASSFLDVKAGSIINNNATDGIEVDGTLQVDVGTLELTGAGELRLVGGTIAGTSASDILDNDGNNITGYGTIDNLVLQNGEVAGSTIDANISGKTLFINTGVNSISNNLLGTLEATAGGILDVQSPLDNFGTVTADGVLSSVASLVKLEKAVTNETGAKLQATNGATLELDATLTNAGNVIAAASSFLDVKAGSIINNNATDGIEVDGTLQVDVGTLELTGAGELRLVGGTIAGTSASDILDNDGNNITGYGTIDNLVLQNGEVAGSTIDANISGKTLFINTGANSISNNLLGTLEAKS